MGSKSDPSTTEAQQRAPQHSTVKTQQRPKEEVKVESAEDANADGPEKGGGDDLAASIQQAR